MTPARMGRGLSFATPFVIPVWKRGEGFEFPNALGLQQVFQIEDIEIPTVPNFGPPFLDARSFIRMTLGGISPIITTLGGRSKVIDTIEKMSRFASTRISRSVKRD